jgi:hypothetical protein
MLMTRAGRRLLEDIGCTQCYVPDLPLAADRRVADVETVYDPVKDIFNTLFATGTPLHDTRDDGTGLPPLKSLRRSPFMVHKIFMDFKHHDLGPNFHERRFDGALTTQFLTTPYGG